jgi:peptidyl-prolyl cis-trans isomerase C
MFKMSYRKGWKIVFIFVFFGLLTNYVFATEKYLAIIDDEVITIDDFESYLRDFHITKNQKMLTQEKEKTISFENLKNLLDKLIEDRLIIREAIQMGLEEDPNFKKALNEYILSESVRKLYEEEIRKKINITDDELKSLYHDMTGKEVSDEEFPKIKGALEKKLRREREEELSKEYLSRLRQRYLVKINHELLKEVDLNGTTTEIVEKRGNEVIVEIDDEKMTLSEFINLSKTYSDKDKDKDRILNDWIDRKLIEKEALKRNYINDSNFKKGVDRFKRLLLRNLFIQKVIIPQIIITEEDLKRYYEENKDKFKVPVRYYLAQITTNSTKEAQEIMNALKNNADFQILAKKKSLDIFADEGGKIGWITKDRLIKPIAEKIDEMKIGDFEMFEINNYYLIIKLLDKTKEVFYPFDFVKDQIKNDLLEQKINESLKKYAEEIKKEITIRVDENGLKEIERTLFN